MLSWRWCWYKLLGFVTPYQCCLNFAMIAFYVFKRCYYKFRIFQNDIAIINCVMQHDVCESHCSFDKNDQIFIFRSSYWLLDDKQNSKALFQETKSVRFISMHCITFYRTCRIFSSLWTSFVYLNCYNILENALTRKSSRYRNLLYTCQGRRVVAK